MKRTLLAAILATAAIAFSCSMEEPAQDNSVVMNPTVTIADFVYDGAYTKTTASFENNVASFAFAATDVMRAYALPDGDGLRFTVKSPKGTACVFEGEGFGLEDGTSYVAYYPGDSETVPELTAVPVDFSAQSQPAASEWNLSDVDFLFATGIQPANGACEFTMKHLGALLIMNITFEKAGVFKSLELCSNANFPVTGTVDLTAENLALTATATADKITLALGGDNGMEVAAGDVVTFYMMVPPVDMSNATLTLNLLDANGNVVLTKEGPGINFEAGKAVAFGATPAAPVVNLSKNGTANSYIVSEAGDYFFDASVAGNGAAGVVNFPADFTKAYPATGTCALNIPADATIWLVLNQNNCISNVTYNPSSKTISFTATGVEGNAKIALDTKDHDHDAYWCWHIWCTDQPGTVTYTTGSSNSLTVMDRNLGAITNAPSQNLEEMTGLYYQFGFPIGFTRAEFRNSRQWADGIITAIHNAQRPMCQANYGYNWYSPNGESFKQVGGYLWSNGTNIQNSGYPAVADIYKTIYDPCPAGYQVAPADLLNAYPEISANSSGARADAYGVYISGIGGEAFFPYNGALNPYGAQHDLKAYGEATDPTIQIWTSRFNAGDAGWCYSGYHRDDTAAHLGIEYAGSNPGRGAWGQGVRCVKSAE